MAFAAVVDWADSSVLCGFEEGGEEVKSFVDNSLSGLCVVHCNDDGGVGLAVSLSGRGEVTGQGFEFDVRVVVFDLMLEFLHSKLVFWEERQIYPVDSYLGPWAVRDNAENVAVG